jgi:hypothetical protein
MREKALRIGMVFSEDKGDTHIMKMIKVLGVLTLALALAAPASALTVTAVDVTTPAQSLAGLLAIDLVATKGGGEGNPNAFEVHATGVRQEYFAGVLATPNMDNAGFLPVPGNDTHLLFAGSQLVAFNGADGPQDVVSPFTSTYNGDQMSLTPAAATAAGSSFAFMHLVYDAVIGGSVSGQVAQPVGPTAVPYSFSFPAGPPIPLPAALPLGLAGMGLLTVIRRKLS